MRTTAPASLPARLAWQHPFIVKHFASEFVKPIVCWCTLINCTTFATPVRLSECSGVPVSRAQSIHASPLLWTVTMSCRPDDVVIVRQWMQ